jgi:hypothetical protein
MTYLVGRYCPDITPISQGPLNVASRRLRFHEIRHSCCASATSAAGRRTEHADLAERAEQTDDSDPVEQRIQVNLPTITDDPLEIESQCLENRLRHRPDLL